MKLYRFPILVGLLNLLSFIIIEIILKGEIPSLNFDVLKALSVFGIIITIANGGALYHALKNKLNNVVIIALLLGTIFGIYLTFSIYAITYRLLMIVDGIVLLIYSKKSV